MNIHGLHLHTSKTLVKQKKARFFNVLYGGRAPYDGRRVLVPNADLFTSRIINNTAAPIRRGSVSLFIGYDSDLEKAVSVIQKATQLTNGVLPKPAASVRVQELGQDDIVVEARFWTDSRRSDFVATASNVRSHLVTALKAAGIGLPDPDVRFLILRNSAQWWQVLGNTPVNSSPDPDRKN